jgi:chain length determinant protein EpsF
VVLVVSLVMPKRYTAKASVLVDIEYSDPIIGQLRSSELLKGYLAAQADLINSERVARRAAKLLNVDNRPDVKEKWLNDTNGEIPIENYYGEQLLSKLDVAPGRNSSVIAISYTAKDPQLAADAANAFAKAYLEVNLETKIAPAKEYTAWFAEQTQSLREELERAHAKAAAYQREHGIFGSDEKRLDVETSRLGQLLSQLAIVQGQRTETSSRQRQASVRSELSPEVLQSPVVQTLRAELVRQEAKLKELEGQLGPRHPQFQRIQDEVTALRARLDNEMRQVVRSVDMAHAVNQQHEAELQAEVDKEKKRVIELTSEHDRLTVLQKDVESAQRAYDLVSQRLSQQSLESKAHPTNVSVFASAEPPVKPSQPKVILNALLAGVLSVLLGIAWVLMRELSRPRLRSPDDIAMALGLPVLVTLPKASRALRQGTDRRPLLAKQTL